MTSTSNVGVDHRCEKCQSGSGKESMWQHKRGRKRVAKGSPQEMGDGENDGAERERENEIVGSGHPPGKRDCW